MNQLCCDIPLPNEKTIAYLDTVGLTLPTRRNVVFRRYRECYVEGGEPSLLYEDTEELLSIARQCAATILANQCPLYVAGASKYDYRTRVIPRDDLEKYPKRYQQVII